MILFCIYNKFIKFRIREKIEENPSNTRNYSMHLTTDYGTPESRGFYFQHELDELVKKKKTILPDGTTLEIGI